MLYISLSLAQAMYLSEVKERLSFCKNDIDLARVKSEILLGFFRKVFL